MRDQNSTRLDAVESVFFQRQLEAIDATLYDTKYPEYKAQMLIPAITGVSESDHVYTYRMFDQTGKARVIGNASDDLPRANATGAETSQVIRQIGASYEYTLREIQAANKTGTPLDQMRALGARRAMEELMDEFLALGSTAHGLTGLLNATGVNAPTSAGFWGTLATADPDNVAADLFNVGAAVAQATEQVFSRVTVVLPQTLYDLAAQLRMSSQSDITVLRYVLATSPYIEAVIPWFRCKASQLSIDSTHDNITAFARSGEVVGALCPQQPTFMAPQERNLSFVVNGVATCGGCVVRYPKGIARMSVPTS